MFQLQCFMTFFQGPSLVSSLKDSSLHNSLRQPAFDLIQTIIVSDATALISSVFNHCTPLTTVGCLAYEMNDDDNDEIWHPAVLDEKESSSWSQFNAQSRITSQECRDWMCIPMLWVEVLLDIHPSILPVSFSKAVFWARCRFCMVESDISEEMKLPVRSWLSTYASEISSSLEWKVPTGSDDGGNGNRSKNSVEVLMMSSTLVRAFSRLTAHFLVQMGQGELRRQWTWEPLMGESLILSLLDSNENVRKFGKCILEQVSNTRGLSSGLMFLCSCKVSLSATFLGLKHAMKLFSQPCGVFGWNGMLEVQLDSVLLKIQNLHHFWFVLCKLLKEEDLPPPEKTENAQSDLRVPLFSSQGGFLKQPDLSSLPVDIDKHASDVDLNTKEKFSYLLSEMAWPIICRFLVKGKEFIDYNLYQNMLALDPYSHPHLRTVTSLLNLLKGSFGKSDMSTIITIEKLISSELTKHVSHLSVSLSRDGSCNFVDASQTLKPLVSESSLVMESTALRREMMTNKRSKENVTVLSDDEVEPTALHRDDILFYREKGHCMADGKALSSDSDCSLSSLKGDSGSTLSTTSDQMLSDIVRDTEDDPLETALKSMRRTQLHVTKPTSALRRQVIQLKTPFENRSGRPHRLEDNLKRFTPPTLNEWYKPILEIDYFAIVGLASARKDENRAVSKLKEVPVFFQSAEQYVEIFRPLVLEEFKAQLHNSFVEMSSWEEMLSGRLSVMSVERVDDFHLVRFIHDDSDSAASKSFSENDLVLLTKDPPQKSSQDVHMVGKVERREKDNKRRLCILLIRFYFQNGSSRLNQARRALTERSKWHACRVISITSQIREFNALSSVKGIPLLPLILNPLNDSFHLSQSKVDLSKLSQSLQKTFRSSFNDSQLQAISVAIGTANEKKNFEFSLIQGPPGTGKTKIIVAIVSGLLASHSQKMNCGQNCSDESLNQTSFRSNTRPRISQTAAIARAWQDAALARQLNDDSQSAPKSMGNCARRRVLICAQSNAAVDELVSRISSQGLYGSHGTIYKPYLVRVGNAKTVHPNSLPFFIDTLVDQRVAEEMMHSSDAKNDLRGDSSGALRSNLEKLVDSIRFYEAKRANLRDGNSNLKNCLHDDSCKGNEEEMSDAEIEMQLRKLYEQKKQIYKDLSNVQAQERKANDEIKALRSKLRKSILREAEIVVTTLSGCGGDLYGVCSETMLSSKFGGPSEHTLFDAVVIDEAAQALEPATLIPLQLLKSRGTKCIMVGDPKQLPATVLSNVASKFLYECSMFERLQRAGHPVIMLNEQYRMHPEICKFPSLHFYDGKLLNGNHMPSKSAPFHQTKCLGPYVFYDITDGQELHGKNSGALSLYNEHEADAAVEILRFFRKRYPAEFIGGRIGIITPYKYQVSLLRSRFLNAFGSSNIADMEFNTVDGFQGREVDILLLSTVRAAHSSSAASRINSSSIGFVADIRRMNVALTRARLSLWILGNARTLQTNYNWAALVKDAKERNLIISAKMPYHILFRTDFNKDLVQNSANCARPLKHEKKVKNADRNVTKSSGKDAEPKEKKDKDEHFSIMKDTSRLFANCDKSTSCDDMIQFSDQSVCNSRRNSKNKMMLSMAKTTLGKKHRIKKETGGSGHKLSPVSPAVGRRDRSSSCKDVSAPAMEDCHKERDADEGRATTQNRVPEISKRKKQREAVDAILYTSLISSKKSETSKISAKRPFPSSATSGSMRAPKTRNESFMLFVPSKAYKLDTKKGLPSALGNPRTITPALDAPRNSNECVWPRRTGASSRLRSAVKTKPKTILVNFGISVLASMKKEMRYLSERLGSSTTSSSLLIFYGIESPSWRLYGSQRMECLEGFLLRMYKGIGMLC
ncbi:helicase SEN1-like [Senna tora]|uniref:Helicase SEN1-like n=1 Tax=Senna tora TaxID=362788 RepID=A0A834WCZ5_9FABA|nr:helicase SEN1-like [Senna tora]